MAGKGWRGANAYIGKVDAMFRGAVEDVDRIGKEFVNAGAEILIETTPGPDLQYAGTDYIATGRLRAGWSYGSAAPLSVPEGYGGPYDTTRGGAATKSRLRNEIMSGPVLRNTFLWNDVGYGYYVHYGYENHTHIGPRPWVYDASLLGEKMMDMALDRAKRPSNG